MNSDFNFPVGFETSEGKASDEGVFLSWVSVQRGNRLRQIFEGSGRNVTTDPEFKNFCCIVPGKFFAVLIQLSSKKQGPGPALIFQGEGQDKGISFMLSENWLSKVLQGWQKRKGDDVGSHGNNSDAIIAQARRLAAEEGISFGAALGRLPETQRAVIGKSIVSLPIDG